MSSLSSSEDVRPAPPILVSTLLELESDQKKPPKRIQPFQTGVKRLDANLPQTLWIGGRVVGIASDRGDAMVRLYNLSIPITTEALTWTICQLAEHLIATCLASLAPESPENNFNGPSVFVIAPPSTSIASTIHDLLQATLPTRSGIDPLHLLDTVQIMQYFDVAGLAESISEVSSCLHDLKSVLSMDSSPLKRHILLVDGLCPALESMQRRGGLVQANALAASVLRSITHLSRSHSSLLVLLNLESSTDTRAGEELTSAFSSPGKDICGISPGGTLQRTLLAGIDTVVLLHRWVASGLENEDLIVEVIKDRVGAGLGHWVAWPRSA